MIKILSGVLISQLAVVFIITGNATLFAGSPSSYVDRPELTLTDKQIDLQAVGKEKKSTMAIGLGAGIWMLPEELDYRIDSVPVAVVLNWRSRFPENISLQAGYSTASATLSYKAYKMDWENKLSTRTLYLSYRLLGQLADMADVYLLAGLAHLTADLQVNKKSGGRLEEVETCRDAGYGYIVGSGLNYMIGWFTVGAELNVLSRTAHFDGIENAVGFSQVLITARFQF